MSPNQVSSALIGTQSVVQAKAFSELIELWLSGQEMVWAHWFTYATLAYFGVTVGFWLYRLNAALGKYDALYIIPMLQASYIVLATIAGGIFFQVSRQSADLSCSNFLPYHPCSSPVLESSPVSFLCMLTPSLPCCTLQISYESASRSSRRSSGGSPPVRAKRFRVAVHDRLREGVQPPCLLACVSLNAGRLLSPEDKEVITWSLWRLGHSAHPGSCSSSSAASRSCSAASTYSFRT